MSTVDLSAYRPATDLLIGQMRETLGEIQEHAHPEQGEDFYCLNLVSWLGERMGPVLRRLADEQAETKSWKGRHAALAEEADHLTAELIDAAEGQAAARVDITDRQLLADIHRWARVSGWHCTWIGWANARVSADATTVVEWDHDELTVRRRPSAEVGRQWPSGLGSVGRRERYPVTSVRQAVDFLVALDVLPAQFSSAYRAAVAR